MARSEDALEVSRSLGAVADAITRRDSAAAPSPTGDGEISCLTEAAIGMTVALLKIADALNNLAAAVRERRGA